MNEETDLSITRVVNASVVVALGDHAILTDPYFEPRWPVRVRERVGLAVAELPRLAAIVGGHRVLDHWQPRPLAAYPHKTDTPVYVASPSMARGARAAGFARVEVVRWHETRQPAPGVTIEVVPAQRAAGLRANSFVFSNAHWRVFVGSEARNLEPLRRYREARGAVDVALLPIDGSALGGLRLVMDPRGALEACRILGARTLVPIHYALVPVPLLLRTPGTLDELLALARHAEDPTVVPLEPGVRASWRPRSAAPKRS